MRDYQSTGGMDAPSAGAPSYATSGRGPEPAYGAELRFGTPSASVIARVPHLSADAAAVAPADEAAAAAPTWRAWFSRKAIAGVAAVVLLAAVSPWAVGLLRDKTETGAASDVKDKSLDVRVELPAPNESTAPAWAGARSDAARWQTADSRDARRADNAQDTDDADRDARPSDSRRTGSARDQRTARISADAGRDEWDDARPSGRTAARAVTRRADEELDADRAEGDRRRTAASARRGDAHGATLSERNPITPPATDREGAAAGVANRSRFDHADDRGDTRTASRGASRYEAQGDDPRDESIGSSRRNPFDAAEQVAQRPSERRRGTASGAQDRHDAPASSDKYASPRDRDEVASQRGGATRGRAATDAVPTAYQDDVRGGDRRAATASERFDEPGTSSNRRASLSRSRNDERDETPYGFSRRDSASNSSRTPSAERAAGRTTDRASDRSTEPSDADLDAAPRYPETRSSAPESDDGARRSGSRFSAAGSREVRSASYDATDRELARFQGGIEEPTYRTSYERVGSSIR